MGDYSKRVSLESRGLSKRIALSLLALTLIPLGLACSTTEPASVTSGGDTQSVNDRTPSTSSEGESAEDESALEEWPPLFHDALPPGDHFAALERDYRELMSDWTLARNSLSRGGRQYFSDRTLDIFGAREKFVGQALSTLEPGPVTRHELAYVGFRIGQVYLNTACQVADLKTPPLQGADARRAFEDARLLFSSDSLIKARDGFKFATRSRVDPWFEKAKTIIGDTPKTRESVAIEDVERMCEEHRKTWVSPAELDRAEREVPNNPPGTLDAEAAGDWFLETGGYGYVGDEKGEESPDAAETPEENQKE
jgi:hypothetical protein